MLSFFFFNIFEVYSNTIWSDYFSIIFYFKFFSSFSLSLAVILFLVQHPVYSVFCLLLVSVFCGFILFLLNFEFLAIILILIYVGGIGILFLFAILLLNFKRFQVKYFWSLPVVFLLEFFCFVQVDSFLNYSLSHCFSNATFVSNTLFFSDIFILGTIMYSEFSFSFLVVGVILFIAMVGSLSIVLAIVYNV